MIEKTTALIKWITLLIATIIACLFLWKMYSAYSSVERAAHSVTDAVTDTTEFAKEKTKDATDWAKSWFKNEEGEGEVDTQN